MTVMWRTTGKGCASEVKYEVLAGGNLKHDRHVLDEEVKHFKHTAKGEVSTYRGTSMCNSPASNWSYKDFYLHTVTLTDLDPGTMYKYGPEGSSEAYTFVTPPLPHRSAPVSFIAYGDMGESQHHQAKSPGAAEVAERCEQRVLQSQVDMVVHAGDLSYADGSNTVWNTFMSVLSRYARFVPYMVAIGNHDYDYRGGASRNDPSGLSPYHPRWGNYGRDSGGECGVPAAYRFAMPRHPAKAAPPDAAAATLASPPSFNSPFWYSYDYGSAHFTVISSEHDLRAQSEQWDWLRADLAAVDRCKTPWLILVTHRPLYVIHPHHSNRKVARHLRRQLEKMLFKYGVDLVVSGHIHSYSRTCAVFGSRCLSSELGGMMHVVVGSGGHKLSPVKDSQPEWIEYALREHGYVVAKLDGGHEGSIEFMEAKTDSVKDRASLTNNVAELGVCRFRYSRLLAALNATSVADLQSAVDRLQASGDAEALQLQRLLDVLGPLSIDSDDDLELESEEDAAAAQLEEAADIEDLNDPEDGQDRQFLRTGVAAARPKLWGPLINSAVDRSVALWRAGASWAREKLQAAMAVLPRHRLPAAMRELRRGS